MNVAIVDDEKREADEVTALIKEYASLNGLDAEISYFPSGAEFLRGYSPFRYTVIFMDIFLSRPGLPDMSAAVDSMTGIDVAEQILEKDSDALIVFLTTSADHMSDALMMHAYDYIRKPADKVRVFRLLDDVMDLRTEVRKCLSFTFGKTEHHIEHGSIVSICADGHCVSITDTDGNEYRPYGSFSSISRQVADDKRFLEVNRGALVNMEHISGFSEGVCVMCNDVRIPVKTKSSKQLEQTWHNYVFAELRSRSRRR